MGLGLPETVLLSEEAGRALLPGPLVVTHLAAGLVKGAAEGEAVVSAVDVDLPGRRCAPSWPPPGPYGRWTRSRRCTARRRRRWTTR